MSVDSVKFLTEVKCKGLKNVNRISGHNNSVGATEEQKPNY